ncbi:MAG TPA: MmcQ/YjbR family DNA-binding protein [Rhizomicrobium sp.]|nr:MmcQ/YjbR family DNA-binding protein [Rhizomicrobium sp.]
MTRVTPNTLVRKIALSLEGVTEIDHWGRPAFRTKKRIFAVMRPDGLYLHLPDERKEFLFNADPRTFVKYMWGKTPNVIVQLERMSENELQALIQEAWEYAAPPGRSQTGQRSRTGDATRRAPVRKKKGGTGRPSA